MWSLSPGDVTLQMLAVFLSSSLTQGACTVQIGMTIGYSLRLEDRDCKDLRNVGSTANIYTVPSLH